MKTKILTMLRGQQDYVSGQQLCDFLGVSRTAVWKVIGQLKEEGYEIEAVKNKGYKLVKVPDILSESELESRICTKWAGRVVHYFDETGSTNNDCRRFMEEGAPHGVLVVADMQKAGKGRRGRTWISPPGTVIAMSIGLRPDFLPDQASRLTLVMALAVCKAVEETTGLAAGIKWPNDIVVNRKKVCGILTEMSAERDYIDNVIIGVGINVNQTDFDEEIAKTATSLRLESGCVQNRASIVQKVMDYFEVYYEEFVKTCDLSAIMKEYNEKLVNRDAQVRVLDPKGAFDGVAHGINDAGELIVTKEDGSDVAVYAGEISVRGIYGYV